MPLPKVPSFFFSTAHPGPISLQVRLVTLGLNKVALLGQNVASSLHLGSCQVSIPQKVLDFCWSFFDSTSCFSLFLNMFVFEPTPNFPLGIPLTCLQGAWMACWLGWTLGACRCRRTLCCPTAGRTCPGWVTAPCCRWEGGGRGSAKGADEAWICGVHVGVILGFVLLAFRFAVLWCSGRWPFEPILLSWCQSCHTWLSGEAHFFPCFQLEVSVASRSLGSCPTPHLHRDVGCTFKEGEGMLAMMFMSLV